MSVRQFLTLLTNFLSGKVTTQIGNFSVLVFCPPPSHPPSPSPPPLLPPLSAGHLFRKSFRNICSFILQYDQIWSASFGAVYTHSEGAEEGTGKLPPLPPLNKQNKYTLAQNSEALEIHNSIIIKMQNAGCKL